MKKDKTIIELIKRIEQYSDLKDIQVVDYWEADLCAIGLKKEDKLMYIGTYSYVDNEMIKYDIDLEVVKDNGSYTVLKEIRGIPEAQLFVEIKQYLA